MRIFYRIPIQTVPATAVQMTYYFIKLNNNTLWLWIQQKGTLREPEKFLLVFWLNGVRYLTPYVIWRHRTASVLYVSSLINAFDIHISEE